MFQSFKVSAFGKTANDMAYQRIGPSQKSQASTGPYLFLGLFISVKISQFCLVISPHANVIFCSVRFPSSLGQQKIEVNGPWPCSSQYQKIFFVIIEIKIEAQDLLVVGSSLAVWCAHWVTTGGANTITLKKLCTFSLNLSFCRC
jgi:hypothetical protein